MGAFLQKETEDCKQLPTHNKQQTTKQQQQFYRRRVSYQISWVTSEWFAVVVYSAYHFMPTPCYYV